MNWLLDSVSNDARSAISSTDMRCPCAAAACPPDQVDTVIHLYKLGWSLARVGNHLNVNRTTVLAALHRRGIPTRDPHGRVRA